MILTIDIGNTNIVFGLYEEKALIHKWRMVSDTKKSVDDYAVDIIEILAQIIGVENFNKLSGCIIGSVVPVLGEKIKNAVAKFFDGKTLLIGQDDVTMAIEIKLDKPQEVGADRLINSIAGFKEFGASLIIIDFGTATTFDVVDEFGAYIGGVIAPGINLSLKALHDATAKLPKIKIAKQENVIGKNTFEAMNSGVYFGYISLIEGIVRRIENELKNKTQIIITGGLAELFKDDIRNAHHRPNLTLEGLLEVYYNN
jgi:type III pantothenate kinase